MKKNKGFTLIELSIVMVIIGLLVGAMVGGASLIRQSRVRSVISEFDKIFSSINVFKFQFQYLPGDFPNAGQIWYNATTCTNAATDAGCNGNGDGIIQYDTNSGGEPYRLWQHMSLAGVINGTFYGTHNQSDLYPSKYPNAVYSARTAVPFQNAVTSNKIEIGLYESTTYYLAINGFMTAIDAYNLDLKIDDGLANSGNLYGLDGKNSAANSCSYPSTSSNGIAAYNLTGSSNNAPNCRLQKNM